MSRNWWLSEHSPSQRSRLRRIYEDADPWRGQQVSRGQNLHNVHVPFEIGDIDVPERIQEETAEEIYRDIDGPINLYGHLLERQVVYFDNNLLPRH